MNGLSGSRKSVQSPGWFEELPDMHLANSGIGTGNSDIIGHLSIFITGVRSFWLERNLRLWAELKEPILLVRNRCGP
jgi:hypothetical protein